MSSVPLSRRKNTLGAVLRAAVRRDLLDRTPLDRVEWRAPARDMTIDVATVPSMADVVAIVDHVSSLDSPTARYGGLFASVGLAGLRPSETISLRSDNLDLPDKGWGLALNYGCHRMLWRAVRRVMDAQWSSYQRCSATKPLSATYSPCGSGRWKPVTSTAV